MGADDEPQWRPLNSHVPHSARVWNYLLGGKDNYGADRTTGELVIQRFPGIAVLARLQRQFLARAVSMLAGECGIRQFLDIGAGLPTVNNTHEVAQRIAPKSRIVYVDNDPMVLAHAKALLTSTPGGTCDYIDADIRDTQTILDAAAVTLDFNRPVALTMLGIMGQLPDGDDPHAIVAQLLDALPPGSYLALSDGTDTNATLNDAIAAYNADSASSYHLRSPHQIARFFDGLDLIEPGVVPTAAWHPVPASTTATEPTGETDTENEVDAICGIGAKNH